MSWVMSGFAAGSSELGVTAIFPSRQLLQHEELEAKWACLLSQLRRRQ